MLFYFVNLVVGIFVFYITFGLFYGSNLAIVAHYIAYEFFRLTNSSRFLCHGDSSLSHFLYHCDSLYWSLCIICCDSFLFSHFLYVAWLFFLVFYRRRSITYFRSINSLYFTGFKIWADDNSLNKPAVKSYWAVNLGVGAIECEPHFFFECGLYDRLNGMKDRPNSG